MYNSAMSLNVSLSVINMIRSVILCNNYSLFFSKIYILSVFVCSRLTPIVYIYIPDNFISVCSHIHVLSFRKKTIGEIYSILMKISSFIYPYSLNRENYGK